MMMTSAADVPVPTPTGAPVDSTVTIAWTSWPPCGRYLFWSTRMLKSGCSLMCVLLCEGDHHDGDVVAPSGVPREAYEMPGAGQRIRGGQDGGQPRRLRVVVPQAV